EAALQRVLLVQAVELHEACIQQHGAGRVLAVVGVDGAIMVQHLGGAGLAFAQARPVQGEAEGGEPPGVTGHGRTSARSQSRPARTRPAMMVSSAIRAGVASPLRERSPVLR